MRISDWSSDVCSSDLQPQRAVGVAVEQSRDERVGKGPLDRDGKNGGLGVSHRIELRHCERSEAIQSGLRKHWIAASPPAPRNDEEFERSADHPSVSAEIGRASGRERVCPYVWIAVVAVSLKKKKKEGVKKYTRVGI